MQLYNLLLANPISFASCISDKDCSIFNSLIFSPNTHKSIIEENFLEILTKQNCFYIILIYYKKEKVKMKKEINKIIMFIGFAVMLVGMLLMGFSAELTLEESSLSTLIFPALFAAVVWS